MGSGMGTIVTPIVGDSGGWENQLGAENDDDWLGNLLPADKSGANGPLVSKSVANEKKANVDVSTKMAKASEMGFLQVGTEGSLAKSSGELAMDGVAWVESRWSPEERGQHRVSAEFEHSAEHRQTNAGTDASSVLTTEPHLAVLNDDTGQVVAHSSRIGSNAVSTEIQEYALEQLLSRIARYILFPGIGLVGKLIADFILDEVFSQIIELQPRDGRVSKSGSTAVSFEASPDTTYRVRFTANNGFAGKTTDKDDYVHAESSSFYELTNLNVEPTGIEGGIFDGIFS